MRIASECAYQQVTSTERTDIMRLVDEHFQIEIEDAAGDLVDLLAFCDRECAENAGAPLAAISAPRRAGGARTPALRPSRTSGWSTKAYEVWGYSEPDSDMFCAHCESLIEIGRETVRECEAFLRSVAADIDNPDGDDSDDASVDVRARYLPGSGWDFASGDPSYDLDHRGFWGSQSVADDDDARTIANTAYDLLREAADDYNGARADIMANAATHEWQIGRFTGARTCAKCGLLPLDDDDYAAPCEGSRS